ncbi:MAG: sulfurtransferase, partial [Planctomycetaceae bacterium]|nr:sulfurtransferase [Planctomycetaceae bacterium]
MAKQHAPRFLEIVSDAKSRVMECDVHEVKARIDAGETFFLVDVREESEYAKGRLPGAVHLGKGIIERDIEITVTEVDATIVLY